MIKKCVYCKQEYETENTGANRVCPSCSKGQNKVAIGCGVVFLLVFVIIMIGSLSGDKPDKDTESGARLYARYALVSQMREPGKAHVEYAKKYRVDGEWHFTGVVSGKNMMGGTSKHAFHIAVRHKQAKPYWDIVVNEIGPAR